MLMVNEFLSFKLHQKVRHYFITRSSLFDTEFNVATAAAAAASAKTMEDCDKNITNKTNVDEDAIVSWMSWFLVLIFVPMITGCGIFWNSAFMFVVYRVKTMRTITNIFLVNLAVADLSVLVVASSQYIGSHINSSAHSHDFSFYSVVGCTLPDFLIYTCYYTSLWTITLVGIERYLAVCRPVWYRHMRDNGRAIRMICIAWVVSTLFASITIPYTTVKYRFISIDGIVEQKPSCCRACKWCKITIYTTDLLQFFISLLINIVLFSLIVRGLNSNLSMKKPNHVRNSVAKMLIINGIVFFVCLTPFSIINVVNLCKIFELLPSEESSTFITLFYWIGRVLFLLNSALNPVVYAFANPTYRAAFKKTFRFRRKKLTFIMKWDRDVANVSNHCM